MNKQLIWLSIGSFVGLGLYGVILSHRIAGPLYRLNRHMLRVAKGDEMGEVSFRKGDFFIELSDSYNAQYKALKSGVREAPDDHAQEKGSA